MEDIIKIVKSLENFSLLLKGVSGTIQKEAKDKKGWLLSVLLDTLVASLLGNMLAGKGINRVGKRIVRGDYGNKKSKGIVRAGHRNKMDF